jgi:hypothetical protein
MTLAVVFKGPEGIVLAADSRVTLVPVASQNAPPGTMVIPVFFDNARKLLSLQQQSHIGIVTSGAAAIGLAEPRSALSYLPEFEEQLSCGNKRARVEEIAAGIGKFYNEQWSQAKMPATGAQPMQFLIAGFDEKAAYGRVFKVSVPNAPDPVEIMGSGAFGLTYDGQAELVQRLLGGFDPKAAEIAQAHLGLDDRQTGELLQEWADNLKLAIPFQFLPLQDCVDLAAFLVSMTSDVQSWTTGLRGVGGEVDVATITRTEGFRPIRQKKIRVWGESDD